MDELGSGMKILAFFAVAAIIIAGINVAVTMIRYYETANIQGYGIYGYVNITLSSNIVINVTNDTINWRQGYILGGQLNASLATSSGGALIFRGNWNLTDSNTDPVNKTGFTVENIGNSNASLTLIAGKNAADFFAGSAGNQKYAWNWTNQFANSCFGGDLTEATWADAAKTPGTKICNHFGYIDGADKVRVDIWLVIPYDSTKTGAQADTITFQAASPA